MGLIYSENFTIRHRDVDRFGKVTLSMLVRLLLEVSGQQTQNLIHQHGNPMADKNLTWFILQHDMDIHRLPTCDETITIETEALAYNRFFTHRQFRVWCNGELIVETMMRFAVVDMLERKLVRISPELVEHYQASEMTKLDAMVKIKRVENDPIKINDYATYFSHIDMNQHVNNAVYVDWVVDSLDSAFLETHLPKKVSIVYENEVRLGDSITHELYEIDEMTIHHLKNGDKSAAKAQIHWEHIKV
ncbi:hypothetical protein KG089_05565 [Carnobacteriaceae bacterium zg-ZUI252]|nr:hypothetical protein [Carnobacteriaceae bacterium zg-ZUI252]